MANPTDAAAGGDALARLRHKYDSAVRKMHELGVQVQKIEMQGSKLLIQGKAASEDAKNKVWDAIKAVDATYGDLSVDIQVTPGVGAGGAAQGGPAGTASAPAQTYTVKAGDTLSKISKQLYGDANQYRRIFDANKDQLTDPDKIKPGQVLRIPR